MRCRPARSSVGVALLLGLFLTLAAGCGEESGQTGTATQTVATTQTGQVVIPATAGPTLSASPEFQRFERSHFGFFRAAGSYPFVRELGVHWQRPHPGPFVWGSIEPARGAYDWSQTDQFVRDAQENQVLLIATIWPFADWDQQQCHEKLPGSPFRFLPTAGDYRGKPCNQDAYQQFVTALVHRYDGDGLDDMPGLIYPIKYWEVINEPELATGTPFFKGDPQSADYLEVLRSTATTIKSSDPYAQVLNGGIANLNKERKPFWDEVLGSGARFVDVLTIHSVPAVEDFNLTSLSSLMGELNLQKPVWVTEILLAPGRGGGHTSTDISPESEQDRWSTVLVQDFVSAFGQGADKLFYLGLDNATPAASAALLVNCGVVIGGELEEDHLQLSDCQRQKAFYAYQIMVDKIDYFDSVELLAPGQYRFLIGGRAVYVLWGGQPLPAELPDTVRLTDLFGGQRDVAAADVDLSGAPVYVEAP